MPIKKKIRESIPDRLKTRRPFGTVRAYRCKKIEEPVRVSGSELTRSRESIPATRERRRRSIVPLRAYRYKNSTVESIPVQEKQHRESIPV